LGDDGPEINLDLARRGAAATASATGQAKQARYTGGNERRVKMK